MFAGLERELEVIVVQSAGNTGFSVDVALDDELPVAAPEECAEVDVSGIFIRVARIEREEGDRCMTADSDAAFEHALSGRDFGAADAVLLSPFALKGCEARRVSAREAPCGGEERFKTERRGAFVDDFGVALDEVEFGEQFVVQENRERGGFVEKRDDEMIFVFERVTAVLQIQRLIRFEKFEVGFVAVETVCCGILVSSEFCAEVVDLDAEPGDGVG